MRGLFVTGTDTGVGKTAVAAGLLADLAREGCPAAPMKPAETGHAPGRGAWPADAACLRDASGIRSLRRDDVVPYVFEDPLAPWVAARRRGTEVDAGRLDAALRRLHDAHGRVVVEGAGGIKVPLTRELDMAGLAARWRLPVLVVAHCALGTLNHTLLTVHHARACSLEVVGVVMNGMPKEPGVAEATNPDALRDLLPDRVPILGVVPDVAEVDVAAGAWRPMADAVADHVDVAQLRRRLE